MKLINGFELMKYAKKLGYILPAFNTTNLETTYAIAKGLSKSKLPGYIQISSNNLRLSNPKVIADLAKATVKDTDTPIGLHLDHGKSFEDVKACVDAGFTSIMIDFSHLSYEENIEKTRQCAEYCHFYGLPVEAELGAIQGKEEDIINEEASKTDPDMVLNFVEQTNCDVLAVSVGNVHGLALEPNIDMPLLKKISEVSPVPLVLHGGSGIPVEVIWKAKKYNLIKINYGSDLRHAYIKTFGEAYLADRNAHDLMSLSMKALENVSEKVTDIVTNINRH